MRPKRTFKIRITEVSNNEHLSQSQATRYITFLETIINRNLVHHGTTEIISEHYIILSFNSSHVFSTTTKIDIDI